MSASKASSSRALNAILPQVPTAPYEAHQKARTFASRYSKSGQYDTAIEVLFQSARELLKTGQTGSGVDLASFLLDVYDTKGEKVTDESRGRVTQLIALTGSTGTWRKPLIDKAVAWTAKFGDYPAGDPELQRYVGEVLFKDGLFEAAEPHLLASGDRDSARLLAELFVQWSAPHSGSAGTFALKGTIPYLLNGNVLGARAFIRHFVSSHPALKSVPTSIPVPVNASSISGASESEVLFTSDSDVNFCQIAVLTCQRANGEKGKVMREAWVRLCGTYQSRGGLLAHPETRKALNDIASLYFGFPPPKAQNANPFGDILSSMLGGGGGGSGSQPPKRVLAPPLPSVVSGGLD
jgi:hypothetical protein